MANWHDIRAMYVSSDISLRKLAEKVGVSYSQIAKVAAAEKWSESRENHRIKTESKVYQETQNKTAEALSDEAAAKARIRLKLIAMAEKWIDQHAQEEVLEDTTDYRRIVQSCVDMGVFDDAAMKAGEGREDDPLTKALKEEAERLQNGDID